MASALQRLAPPSSLPPELGQAGRDDAGRVGQPVAPAARPLQVALRRGGRTARHLQQQALLRRSQPGRPVHVGAPLAPGLLLRVVPKHTLAPPRASRAQPLCYHVDGRASAHAAAVPLPLRPSNPRTSLAHLAAYQRTTVAAAGLTLSGARLGR